MQRLIALFLAVSLTAEVAFGAPVVLPALLKSYPQAESETLMRSGELLGVSFSAEGEALYARKVEPPETAEPRKLSTETAKRFVTFLSKLPKDDPEQGLALALRSYLAPRMPAAELDSNMFLRRDEKGRLVPTRQGLNALADILMATDGEKLEPLSGSQPNAAFTAASGGTGLPLDNGRAAGSPVSAGLNSVGRHSGAMASPAAAFDGARHELGGFDWASLGAQNAAPGGLASVSASRGLEGFSINEEEGTVRVLVAAAAPARQDHLKVDGRSGAQAEVFRQTGLDETLFTEHRAKVVRVVDNIVAIDIPLDEAASLGLALQERGIESRPARVYKAASAAAESFRGAAGALLGGQFLPVPAEDRTIPVPEPIANPQMATPPNKLASSKAQVHSESLRSAGMTGKGVVVGVIDSGIDMDHADFKNADGVSRVQDYMDFTEEGKDDVVGHGTHVSGIIGGSGAASDGAYRGSAADVRFRVAKVFGTKGETDESVILAAMKWMTQSDRPEDRVDLVNMSLGGPGVANKDPLSSMANHLAAKNNILVVAAAGNSGPFENTIGSPGNARYVLTVGGVDKEGKPAFFSSRGPILDEGGALLYGKPDLVGVSGNVDFSQMEYDAFEGLMLASPSPRKDPAGGLQSAGPAAAAGKCIYGPGIISARSSKDQDSACTLEGNPGYRYMSGTSQAAPMAAGFAADVIGYAKANGAEVDAFQIKAVLMETASDIEQKKEFQGAGLLDGRDLASTVTDRVFRGIPIGNVAFSLAMRLSGADLDNMKNQRRYQMTPLGLWDTQTGGLINSEAEMDSAIHDIRQARPPVVARRESEDPSQA